MWSEWQLAEAMVLSEKNCTGNPESPVFHHSKCYLMISISILVSIHFCLDFQASKNRTPKKAMPSLDHIRIKGAW